MNDLETIGSGELPTAAEVADAFANITTTLAPLVEGLRQFGEQIGALGRAYCEVIDAFGQRMAEESWALSGDAARWRPESVD